MDAKYKIKVRIEVDNATPGTSSPEWTDDESRAVLEALARMPVQADYPTAAATHGGASVRLTLLAYNLHDVPGKSGSTPDTTVVDEFELSAEVTESEPGAN